MSWRTLFAATLGLLLTLPLAWLFYVATPGLGANKPRTQDKTPVPMLSPEERRSLLTYGRNCETDNDCEAPLRCFFSSHTMSRYCTDSRCLTDMQCQEGFICRTQTVSNGDPLRVCSLVGVRKEGEVCLAHSPSNDYACEQGLRCNSRCGRPCELDEPSSCPEGTVCHQYRCHKACAPEDPASCAPGFVCHQKTAKEPWRCVPAPRAASEPSP
jgi:hypothetical protein